MFIEILFKMLLFKGGVLIYAEHCIYIYIYIYIYTHIHTYCIYIYIYFYCCEGSWHKLYFIINISIYMNIVFLTRGPLCSMLCQKGPDLSDVVKCKLARSTSLCNVLLEGQLVIKDYTKFSD